MKRVAPFLLLLAGCGSGTYVELEFSSIPTGASSIGCTLGLAGKQADVSFDVKSGGSSQTGSLEIQSGSGSMTVRCSAKGTTESDGSMGTVTVVRDKTVRLALSFGGTQPDGGTDAGADMPSPDLNGTDLAGSDMTVLTPMVTMTPSARDFGPLTVNSTSAPASFTVTNNGAGATSALDLVIDNAAFTLSSGGTCQGMTLAAGDSCTFSVVFKPTVSGPTAGHVTVTYAGQTGAPPSSTLSGTGVAPGALAWTPTEGTFDPLLIGSTSATQAFTLKNMGGTTTGTIAVSLGGSDATSFEIDTDGCTGNTLAANATCVVLVDFAPMASGALSATLQGNATPGGAAIVSLSGTGLSQAALKLTPDTSSMAHEFGTLDIGMTSGVFALKVENTGGVATGAVTFSLPAGVAAASGSNCVSGSALAANGSCTLNLTYTPNTYGDKNPTITFTASPGGTKTAVLHATGRDYVTVAVAPLPDATFGSIVDDANHFDCGGSGTMCQYVYPRTADIAVTFTATPATNDTFVGWTYANSPPPCANATSPMCVVTLGSSVTGAATSTASSTPLTYNANFTD